MQDHSRLFEKQMKSAKLDAQVIRTFKAYYEQLVNGEKGLIADKDIQAPSARNLIKYEEVSEFRSQAMLKKTVVIKLNGGLGTSMGLSKAKSLLPVKGNLNFLDIIVRQVLALRADSGYDVQLLFMNSYNTEKDTLKYLDKYPDLAKQNLPISFVQNKFPRIRKDNLALFESDEEEKKWNPPGHGDLYTALAANGLLDELIEKGYRYAFVSNADNLAATVDTAIPAYMEANQINFVMEVCTRSSADRKGGHLCEDVQKQLLLRELAQTPEDDLHRFQDIDLYQYFNTNNLWLDLKALQWNMISNDGIMLLPLIINPKIVDGTEVYQLETAMGSAISVFTNTRAIKVPRSRFAPVKTNSDLLAVWSDAYELNDRYQLVLKRGLEQAPLIELDERYYGKIDQLLKRFSEAVPSLASCSHLSLKGDISFGEDVICEGKVSIESEEAIMLQGRRLAGEIKL